MWKQRIISGDNLASCNAGCIKYRKRKDSAVPVTTVFWLYFTQPTVVMFHGIETKTRQDTLPLEML